MSTALDQARAGFATLDFDAEVRERALASLALWLDEERFADFRPQLLGLIERQRWATLFDGFWQTIPFGTGGRRGPVGIGPNRFNTWTLLTSVQGHAEILRESYPGEELSVVLAFDVRRFLDARGVYDPGRPNPLLGLSSADFARMAAEVYTAAGIHVRMLDPDGGTYMATPELSLAIRRHGAHGGLNVSASHNHPDDNGGKVYNRFGGQDVPPDDEVLADRVEGITEVRRLEFEDARAQGLVSFLGPEENAHYLSVNRALSLAPDARGGRIVYTPLSGVGSVTVGRLLREQGFDVRAVPGQEEFDGSFPTVKFLAPNPEVPTCYSEAEKVADAVDADIILATDPDADRIGMEVRQPGGGWFFVNGNEIVLLVVRALLERRRELGTLPSDGFGLTTVVSSSRITTIARSYGVHMVNDLLVGFKGMAHILACLERDGRWRELRCGPEAMVFGAEESHGLLLTHEIRDKCAAGPALVLAELNARLRADGRTMLDELDAIYKRFGYMTSRLSTMVMTGASGLARIRAIQASLREQPPAEIAGRKVIAFDDLQSPDCWMGPIKSGTDAAGRNVLVMRLEGDARVIIRPSGTEPKSKLYIEVPGVTPTDDLTDAELAAERRRCDREADELTAAFERLALARIGIELTAAAGQVSPLVGLDHKVDFGARFLPALGSRARNETQDLDGWIDEALAAYGREPRELVAPGVAAWLSEATLSPAAEARVRRAFGLPERPAAAR